MTDKYVEMTKESTKFRHDPRQMAVIKTLDEYSQQITSAQATFAKYKAEY
jgi:hypothetical protein